MTLLIYALLGEEAPEDMKGVFPQKLVPGKDLGFREASVRSSGKEDYSEDQEEEVKEKLKDLGYM